MEKLLVGCLIVLCSTFSTAAEKLQMEVVCDSSDKMFNRLKNEFDESVVLYGESVDDDLPAIITSVWVSKTSGTMSVVRSFVKEKVSCLVAVGDNIKYKSDSNL